MENNLEYARQMDANDPLNTFRSKFHFPNFMKDGMLYFTGNSLGLQPKSARAYIEQELDTWSVYGVEGHFMGKNPWFSYHELLTEKTA